MIHWEETKMSESCSHDFSILLGSHVPIRDQYSITQDSDQQRWRMHSVCVLGDDFGEGAVFGHLEDDFVDPWDQSLGRRFL